MDAELAPPPVTRDLGDPALYLNHELSLLEFNRRVLAQALDPDVPLLERLRFLTIFSSNLDEFFEIRVAGLKQRVALDLARPRADGLSPQDTLRRINQAVHALVAEQYAALQEVLLPALEEQGVRLLKRSAWTEEQRAWIEAYFNEQALPVLTPVALDPAHPFPNVQNKSLNFIVSLRGADAFGRNGGNAVVQVPRCLPRIIALPAALCAGQDFVMISSVIHANVTALFPGMEVLACHQFRVTRNSDLWVDEEEVDDLMSALKGELPRRNYGAAVRLEVADDCEALTARFLLNRFDLSQEDLFRVNGPVNLHRLSALYEQIRRPDLKFPPFLPGLPDPLEPKDDLFEQIRAGDVLLHHPYQSFNPVVDLLTQAAKDPAVLAIKQTLYRTGPESPVVEALLEAARNGKAVTAVVELRARFDEAANIRLATRLQEAGASVAYGVVDYKCHAKVSMIVRREGKQLRRYVHLGTGNYHTGTSRAYTDLGLLTCDPDVGEDAHALFLQLTGLGRVPKMRSLVLAPFTMKDTILRLIDAEAEAARAGRPSRIQAKMNALTEPAVVVALYRASQAGVPIDLVVRGICCLRPGVPGVSETIRVRSVVGRFLEHARVYAFHAGGEEKVFCASADWRTRNLFRRVEVAFPVRDPALAARVRYEALSVALEDNTTAWDLGSDGVWVRARPGEAPALSMQSLLLESMAD